MNPAFSLYVSSSRTPVVLVLVPQLSAFMRRIRDGDGDGSPSVDRPRRYWCASAANAEFLSGRSWLCSARADSQTDALRGRGSETTICRSPPTWCYCLFPRRDRAGVAHGGPDDLRAVVYGAVLMMNRRRDDRRGREQNGVPVVGLEPS